MTGLIFSPFSSPLSTEHLIFFCLTESYNKSCNTPVGCNGPAFTCNKETLFCECADNFVFSNGSCCSLSQFGSSCRSNDDCAEELHEICVERNCSCASHYHRDNKKLMCVASKETGKPLLLRED